MDPIDQKRGEAAILWFRKTLADHEREAGPPLSDSGITDASIVVDN
jgi:hypothetical protein